MVLFTVGLCVLFIISSTLYLITKQLLKMKDQKRYPDDDESVNPNPGGGGGTGNPDNPNPGEETP